MPKQLRLIDLIPADHRSADLSAMWDSVLKYPTDEAPWLVFADKLAEDGWHGLEKAIRERKQIRIRGGKLASSFWTDGVNELSVRGDSLGHWAVCGIFKGFTKWNWFGWHPKDLHPAKKGYFEGRSKLGSLHGTAQVERIIALIEKNKKGILAALRGDEDSELQFTVASTNPMGNLLA